jgi:hypothetical protein
LYRPRTGCMHISSQHRQSTIARDASPFSVLDRHITLREPHGSKRTELAWHVFNR